MTNKEVMISSKPPVDPNYKIGWTKVETVIIAKLRLEPCAQRSVCCMDYLSSNSCSSMSLVERKAANSIVWIHRRRTRNETCHWGWSSCWATGARIHPLGRKLSIVLCLLSWRAIGTGESWRLNRVENIAFIISITLTGPWGHSSILEVRWALGGSKLDPG